MITPKVKKDDLTNFVKNYIIPLKRSSSPLNTFGEYLRRELSGRDVLYIPEKFRKIVLGGVQENGSFSPNSMAEFYSEYFGIGLPQIDRVRYMNFVKNGVNPEGIIIRSDPTGKKVDFKEQGDFSMFHYVSAIDSLCTAIINKSVAKGIISQSESSAPSISNENEEEALIDNPLRILTMTRDFYNTSLSILPTYNEYSIFLNSIRVPKDYLMQAYPSIENEFSSLMNNLDLETKDIADLPITIKYIEYVFPKQDGIASNIFQLYGNVFNLSHFLSVQPNTIFDGVMDEYPNFLRNAVKSLNGVLDTTASILTKSTERKISIDINEKGFTSDNDSNFPIQHISVISKSISPLLFSGSVFLESGYRGIVIYNNMAGMLQ